VENRTQFQTEPKLLSGTFIIYDDLLGTSSDKPVWTSPQAAGRSALKRAAIQLHRTATTSALIRTSHFVWRQSFEVDFNMYHTGTFSPAISGP
jgi:hypothetical protein